ncbi:purine-nucleoside phosphorylase [uncultured Rikenella sp.]|uniref:purine-nucleoside phosphorylase n=1 Tax=uncultured Rikenella sp. TaxID=368003 RepID=UPI002632BFBA|nr:purine-nucleoside phosphorylase [uncultured Rikenella sp.]
MSEKIKNTTCFIRSRLNILPRRYFTDSSEGTAENGGRPAPEVGIVLGSGLGALAEMIDVISTLDYSEIPDFPTSTVAGHRGRFIYGRLGGKYVIAMEGRVHYYEGYPIDEVVLPVRAMCCLGIDTLIVSNAAGGLCPLFEAGDVMVIRDHINLIPNPLVGPNPEELGVRFPDMGEAYDRKLITLAHEVARAQGIVLREGVYVGSSGPSFETPAEVRYFRRIGGDAIGMSTTPEVIVARHQRVRVLGFSLITNVLSGVPARLCGGAELTHEEVIEAGKRAMPGLCALVREIITRL